ncbi:MAG: DUF2530 domain-containing protein [Propionicimonas sp.]|nr:DUF2530 domain-containing protein [Propionicimonas sp.]MEA4942910.1 DUF2530 domain-containing protein [Propionicimonas sp.]
MVQAPVRALDPDGTGIVTIGTIAFVIATVVLWLQRDALNAAGQGWWLWVCVTGVGIGLVGMAVVWVRSHRRKRSEAEADPAPTD